jgi:two-component system, chemotaxis family, sensor kinase Cph1
MCVSAADFREYAPMAGEKLRMKHPGNYDSDFCGSLPLSFINQIQGYGCLLVADRDLNILQVSENVSDFFVLSPEELVKSTIKDVCGHDLAEEITSCMSASEYKCAVRFSSSTTRTAVPMLTVITFNSELVFLEIEHGQASESAFISVYQHVRRATQAIERAESIEQVMDIAVKELKGLSGFDKVMVYQFDQDWNGHVVAEAKEEGMAAYLGLHFPASDVPRQARDLYLKNSYRQIPDRDYKGSRLFPLINPHTGIFSDMSSCNLRGVAKVHLEYLSNMQVGASMSTRILKEGKLWGLISCHHRKAFFLPYERCSIFELLSGIISAQIVSLEVQQDLKESKAKQKIQSRIVEHWYRETTTGAGIRQSHSLLLELLNCTGLVFTAAGNFQSFGACPSEPEITRLLLWLQTKDPTQVYATDQLSLEYDEGANFSRLASGLLALPVHPGRGEYLLVFRKELERLINWGGNPNEAIVYAEDKQSYHPRNSFATWQEQVQHRSEPFTKAELYFAGEIQRIAVAHRLRETQFN